MDTIKGAYDPKIDPFYSGAVTVDGSTTYTQDQILDCKGPGE